MEPDSSPVDHELPSTPSPGSEHQLDSLSTILPTSKPNNGLFGKHRLAAAISNLQNEINFLQEELEQLETLGESSIVCKELISSVESIPDPLLPWCRGPSNNGWDRWFRGAHNTRKRWI
ncbi:guanine nucleotide-binding protein subunit gamma 2-like [Euphorbia lathyris]|uniref:guanine nucleotide-binding protein subunit gamma 2-like n=1 Tax=Euphorbia lathyris TaxID=212925 RepID=UPI0033132261